MEDSQAEAMSATVAHMEAPARMDCPRPSPPLSDPVPEADFCVVEELWKQLYALDEEQQVLPFAQPTLHHGCTQKSGVGKPPGQEYRTSLRSHMPSSMAMAGGLESQPALKGSAEAQSWA